MEPDGKKKKEFRRRRKAFTRSEAAQSRARRALNLIRRKGYSLGRALRETKTSSRTLRKHFGSELLPTQKGQRIRVRKEDNRTREMLLMTALGDVPKKFHGSRNASLNAMQRRAALHFLRKGDDSLLNNLPAKTVEGIELLTDPELISVLAQQGAIKPEQFYTSVGGEA